MRRGTPTIVGAQLTSIAPRASPKQGLAGGVIVKWKWSQVLEAIRDPRFCMINAFLSSVQTGTTTTTSPLPDLSTHSTASQLLQSHVLLLRLHHTSSRAGIPRSNHRSSHLPLRGHLLAQVSNRRMYIANATCAAFVGL